VPTAAIVVEVVSPDDETYEKLDFYATHHVDELLVADPAARSVRCWRLDSAGYVEVPGSDLLAVTADEVAQTIAWP
jgi:Uma2 family endonuclease